MRILALERPIPGVSDAAFTPALLREESARAWELHQAGSLRELYFRADREEAVLALECVSLAEAEGVLASLPLVREGLVAFDLLPLRAYPGFARLFASPAVAITATPAPVPVPRVKRAKRAAAARPAPRAARPKSRRPAPRRAPR